VALLTRCRSTTITLNLNGRGHRLEVLNSNQEITIDQL
jgi:hypothetical protein